MEGFPNLCRVWVDACVLDVLAAEAAAHGGWPDPWPALRRNQNLLLWQAAMTDAFNALRQTIGTNRMAAPALSCAAAQAGVRDAAAANPRHACGRATRGAPSRVANFSSTRAFDGAKQPEGRERTFSH